jgi:hypothetical protein
MITSPSQEVKAEPLPDASARYCMPIRKRRAGFAIAIGGGHSRLALN